MSVNKKKVSFKRQWKIDVISCRGEKKACAAAAKVESFDIFVAVLEEFSFG